MLDAVAVVWVVELKYGDVSDAVAEGVSVEGGVEDGLCIVEDELMGEDVIGSGGGVDEPCQLVVVCIASAL